MAMHFLNHRSSPWASALLGLVAATLLNQAMDPLVSLTSQAMVYVLLVQGQAYFWGGWTPWVTAFGAVLALNFFFVPPRWTFAVSEREHLVALGVMLLVGAMTSQLTKRLREQNAWAQQQERSRLRAEQEAARQEMLNTFLAAISHDLRTPLATIIGASSSLQSQKTLLSATQQNALLQSIQQEAAYLATLSENTLQFVRLSCPSPNLRCDWQSWEEIIGAVLPRTRALDPLRRVRVHLPPALPLVQADPVLLGQLLFNLLDNALRYTSGPVDIVLSAQGLETRLQVSDQGKGIPVAAREAVFQPYTRHDRSGQHGSGLGLALCRAIAQAHQGRLELEPSPTGGCCFSLTLPCTRPPPSVGEPP